MKMDMTESRQYVRDFAKTFPSVHVLMALTMCEVGILEWDVVAKIFQESLVDALEVLVTELSN